MEAFVVLGRAATNGVLDIDGIKRVGALKLARKKYPDIDCVIFAGGAKSKSCQTTEASQMHALLEDDFKQVILEEYSRTTAENAWCVASLAKAMKIDRIIIVTSHEHMLRSWIFFRFALRGSQIKTKFFASSGRGLAGWLFEIRCLFYVPQNIKSARIRAREMEEGQNQWERLLP